MKEKVKLTNTQVRSLYSGLKSWKNKTEVDFRFSAELIRAKKALKDVAEEIDEVKVPAADFKEYQDNLQSLIKEHAVYTDKDKTKMEMKDDTPVMKSTWKKAFAELQEKSKETIDTWKELSKGYADYLKSDVPVEFLTISTEHMPKQVPLINVIAVSNMLRVKSEELKTVAISNDFITYWDRVFSHKLLTPETLLYVNKSLALKLAFNKNVVETKGNEYKSSKVVADYDKFLLAKEELTKDHAKKNILGEAIIKVEGSEGKEQRAFYQIEDQGAYNKAIAELKDSNKEVIDLYETFMEQDTELSLWMITEQDMEGCNVDYEFLDIFIDMTDM